MPKLSYYVFVVELARSTQKTPALTNLNPKAAVDAPCVYVGTTLRYRPGERYDRGAFTTSKNRVIKKFGRKLLSAFQTRHTRKEGALSRKERLVEELREQGWFVMNSEPRSEYRVYVLELDPRVRGSKRARTQNPDADPSKPCVYVGQTRKTAEERLREHRSRIRSRLGTLALRLHPSLPGESELMTELESLREERQLAHRLRRSGYTVLGGH